MKSFSFLVSSTSNVKPVAADRAGVADLAAGLAVERGSIEDEDQRAPPLASADSASRFCSRMPMTRALSSVVVVADELAAVVVFPLERIERAGREHVGGLGRAARDDRVPAALDLEAGAIDAQVVVGRQALDDFDRDAVRRVQGEGVLARDRVGAGRLGLLEDVVQELAGRFRGCGGIAPPLA